MDRRSFIRLTAVSGTGAALASCGTPEHELIRFLPDEDIVPGEAVWKPSVCPLCASGCGLTVRLMDADADVVRDGRAGVVRILAAKKLEGSAGHPISGGRLCARGQAAIQVTYHPDRITQPLRRSGERGDGRYEATTWEEAIAEVVSRLDALVDADAQRALAYLGRPGGSHRSLLVDEFLARFGAPPAVRYELFGDEVLRRANDFSFGRDQVPTLDLARARYVLSFGADFLGTWGSPVAQGAAYGAMRQGRPGIRGTFVQVEPRMSQTGANADWWLPARPGTEGMLALGVAHVITAEGLIPAAAAAGAGTRIEGWSAGLAGYAPEQVEAVTGVPARHIERLARELVEQRPSVALIAGAPLAHTNGLFSAMAVNALNALLGSVGQPGGLGFMPQIDVTAALKLARRSSAPMPLETFAREVQAGGATAPQVVFLDGANPVFGAPRAWNVAEVLAAAPFIVSFGSFLDETSALADLILPDHSFLEAWTDALPEAGAAMAVISSAPPAMRPLHATRATGDVLLEIARGLRTPLDLPWETYEEMLQATYAALPGPSPDLDAWFDAEEKGGWWGTLPAALSPPPPPPSRPVPGPMAFEAPRFEGDSAEFPFHLLPYASSAFLDGSVAHLPWLQEMPDPLTSAMWSSWVEINPVTAEGLGIQTGDVVEVTSPAGTLRTAAVMTPGIAPDVVAMPAGQGHRRFTRYASGRGANPVELLAPLTVAAAGAPAWAATRVRVTRVTGPDGRLVLFAGGLREHLDEGR